MRELGFVVVYRWKSSWVERLQLPASEAKAAGGPAGRLPQGGPKEAAVKEGTWARSD